MSLSNAVHYRTWQRLTTTKPGLWEVAIEQETADGYHSVANLSYTMVEKAE